MWIWLVLRACVAVPRTCVPSVNGETFTHDEDPWQKGGAIQVVKSDTCTIGSTTISNCLFENCVNAQGTGDAGGGAIYVENVKLECSRCNFTKCTAERGRGGAIFATVGSEVKITWSNFSECQTKHQDTDSMDGGAIWAKEMVVLEDSVLERCKVPNPPTYMPRGGAIICHYLSCSRTQFQGCTAGGDGGTIYISKDDERPSLSLIDCNVSQSSAEGTTGGVIIYEGNGTVDMRNCVIKECSAKQSNSAVVDLKSQRETAPNGFAVNVVQCIFQGNQITADTSASVRIDITLNDAQYDYSKCVMSNCTFVENNRYQFSFLVWNKIFLDPVLQIQFALSIVGCSFTSNTIDVPDGVMQTMSNVGVSYVDCTFEGNKVSNPQRLYGIVRFYDGVYSFSGCRFVEWTAEKPILYVPNDVHIPVIKLSNCVFENCSSTEYSGIFGPLQCQNVTIEGCSFTGCSGCPALVEIQNVEFLTFSRNVLTVSLIDFMVCKAEQVSSLDISLGKGVTIFEHDLFHVDVSSNVTHSMMTLTCSSDSEIQFFNCCFNHVVTAETAPHSTAPMYLNVTGVAGHVNFSQVCFDTEKAKAISSEVPISYQTEEEYYFGDKCACWTEKSSRRKVNIGLIIGIVIALLILIVILIIVIIVVRRRQKAREGSSEGQAVSEETVTSISDEMTTTSTHDRETAESPLFMSREVLGTFGHHFEEQLNF